MKISCVLLSDFEVAVELARYPDLAGKPVIVGGLPHERKSVRSRSREAAACGVTEGMPLREAQGLCPEAVFLPADDNLYRRVLSRVLATLDAFSPRVEAVSHQLSTIRERASKQASEGENAGSTRPGVARGPVPRLSHRGARAAQGPWGCASSPQASPVPGPRSGRAGGSSPAASQHPTPNTPLITHHSLLITHHSASVLIYLDASGLEMLFGPDLELGERIVAVLEARMGLQPRVGIASGKFVAQMAATTATQGTVIAVRTGEERTFLAPLPAEWIPCSKEMQRRLDLFGLRTMGQLATLPRGALGEQFGREGVEAARLARGIDERPVVPQDAPTIMLEEVEIDPPAEETHLLMAAARQLAKRLERRMKSGFAACQDVSLDIGFEDGTEIRLETALHERTNQADTILRAVERLLGRAYARVADSPGTEGKEGREGQEGRGDVETGRETSQGWRDGKTWGWEDGPHPDPSVIRRAGGLSPAAGAGETDGYAPDVDGPHPDRPDRALTPRYSLPSSLPEGEGVRLPVPQSPSLPVSSLPSLPSLSPPLVSLLRISLSNFGSTHGEQLELLPSRAGGIKKVRQAVRRAEELFGDESISLLAQTTHGRPPASRIGVIAEPDGQPHTLFIDNRRERVREISNRWRVQEEWWRREVLREYYRVITDASKLCLIYRDLLGGGWFLERIYG